jgi:EmrB/QacA subfamily drug resistance transporter
MAKTQAVSPHARHIIYLMMLGNFVASMNQTMLGPVLPSIMDDLHITAVQGQWLTTIYLLVNGIMIPCTAYLSARFTTRQLFLASMILFTCGTTVAGLAHSLLILLAARVLQAMGFGILAPLTMSTMLIVYPRSQHGRAMGNLGIVISAAPAVGPSLAGWVVDNHSWNAVFLMMVPLLVADIAITWWKMKSVGEPHRIPLDLPSVILSTIGFGGLLYGFSVVGDYGWTSPHTLVSLALGGVVTVLFFRRQLRIPTPLLQVRVFKDARFTLGTVMGMFINAALLFGGILTPIYLQQMHGYSAFQSALIMLPAAILSIILSPITGRLYDRFKARYLILTGVGMLGVGSLLYATFQVDSPTWYLVAIYTIRIAGIGVTMMPVNTWSMKKLDNATIPHGTACNNTLRQVAGSIGTAIFISVYSLVQPLAAGAGPVQMGLFGIHAAFFSSGVILLAVWVLAFIKVKD